MKRKLTNIFMSGVIATTSIFGNRIEIEVDPVVKPLSLSEIYENTRKMTNEADPEFVGHNIPERNIPEDRLKVIRLAQKKREKEIEAERLKEQQRKAQELQKQRERQLAKQRQQRQEKSSQDSSQKRSARFTAYYPDNSEMQGGYITATGYDLRNGLYYQGYRVIASDSSIPLYSILELEIEGYGTMKAIVLDRGGRINGNLFDVTFPDRDSAFEFGRRSGTYKIIRRGRG